MGTASKASPRRRICSISPLGDSPEAESFGRVVRERARARIGAGLGASARKDELRLGRVQLRAVDCKQRLPSCDALAYGFDVKPNDPSLEFQGDVPESTLVVDNASKQAEVAGHRANGDARRSDADQLSSEVVDKDDSRFELSSSHRNQVHAADWTGPGFGSLHRRVHGARVMSDLGRL